MDDWNMSIFQALRLLVASLVSDSVLTNAFLREPREVTIKQERWGGLVFKKRWCFCFYLIDSSNYAFWFLRATFIELEGCQLHTCMRTLSGYAYCYVTLFHWESVICVSLVSSLDIWTYLLRFVKLSSNLIYVYISYPWAIVF